jgi:serine/threonine protein kinase/ABC-type branched-subunit amino acid transport system substrate-binding protein
MNHKNKDVNVSDPFIGRTLKGAYRIESLIADGGMSRVYLAEQLSLSRKVVIKVLVPEYHNTDFSTLFIREARINSQLNHPNIVSVFDFDATNDSAYLAMEYLDGGTLADIVQKQSGFTVANITWVMEQLCAAIHSAHKLGIVHRDIKPGNIMIARMVGGSTIVKVVDFGISKPMCEADLKHTQLGTVIGTPGYLSPEQIQGKPVDTRADLYSVGAILYYMATGMRPYCGENREIIMRKQLGDRAPLLHKQKLKDSYCQVLQPIIDKAMKINPDERYQTIQALWRDFIACLTHQRVNPEQDSAAHQHAQPHPYNNKKYSNTCYDETKYDETKYVNTIYDNTALNPNALYQFVYQGELVKGFQQNTVKYNLSEQFKYSEQQIESLFSQKRIIVRKNLNHQDALRFIKLFHSYGAVGLLEAMPTQPSDEIDQDKEQQPASLPEAGIAQPVSLSGFSSIKQEDAKNETPYTSSHTQAHKQFRANELRPEPISSKLMPGLITHYLDNISLRTSLLAALTASTLLLALFFITVHTPLQYSIMDRYQSWTSNTMNVRGVTSSYIRFGLSIPSLDRDQKPDSSVEHARAHSMRVGIETLFEQINDEGGIHGRKLQLQVLENHGRSYGTTANNRDFTHTETGILALLGHVGSPSSFDDFLTEILDKQLLVMATGTGTKSLRQDPPDRYVFNYRASYSEESAALMKHYLEALEMNAKHIGVLYQDDEDGRDALSGIREILQQKNETFKSIISVGFDRKTGNITTALEQFLAEEHQLEGLIIIAPHTTSANLTYAMRLSGFQGHIANLSLVDSQQLISRLEAMSSGLSEGIIVSQVVPMFNSHSTGVLEYRKALEHYFPEEKADALSLESYLTARIIVEALRLEGRYFNNHSLTNRLNTMTEIDIGIGKGLSFSSSDHQANHKVWGSRIGKNGKLESLDLERYAPNKTEIAKN